MDLRDEVHQARIDRAVASIFAAVQKLQLDPAVVTVVGSVEVHTDHDNPLATYEPRD